MLKFFQGQLPKGYSFSFEPSIFNTQEHLQLQSGDGWNSFYALDEPALKVCAAFHFNLKDQTAVSPRHASFGGLELDDNLNDAVVSDFVDFVVDELGRSGVQKIMVKQSPFVREDLRVVNSFLSSGFKIQLEEVDSFLKVSGSFVDRLQERKAQKLRSQKKMDWVFRNPDQSHLFEMYQFISKCRSDKGYSLSMSFQQIEQLTKTFPQQIFLFQILEKKKIIAASICIKIKSDWLYDFYHDHNAEYDADGPILFLVELIYEFCSSQSINWIELGTSMKGEEVNEGLLAFKKQLGAITVPKITFVKEF